MHLCQERKLNNKRKNQFSFHHLIERSLPPSDFLTTALTIIKAGPKFYDKGLPPTRVGASWQFQNFSSKLSSHSLHFPEQIRIQLGDNPHKCGTRQWTLSQALNLHSCGNPDMGASSQLRCLSKGICWQVPPYKPQETSFWYEMMKIWPVRDSMGNLYQKKQSHLCLFVTSLEHEKTKKKAITYDTRVQTLQPRISAKNRLKLPLLSQLCTNRRAQK